MGLDGFLTEDILVNIRTFDTRSLIVYAYDYLNNFVQLHIEDASKIVFTFNSERVIHRVVSSVESICLSYPSPIDS